MARLEVCKIRKVSRLEVADQPLTVGRASDNAIVLSNTHVSRHHCVIEFFEGKPRVRDLDSSTGTFLNGKRVTDAQLHHGDRITVGPFDLRFRDPNFTSPADLPEMAGGDETGDTAVLGDGPGSDASAHATAHAEREIRIASREAASTERERRTIERETRLARREVEIAGREQKIERRSAEIEERIRQVDQSDSGAAIPAVRGDSASEGVPLESLRVDLAAAANARASDAAQMQQLQNELDALRHELVEARDRITHLEASHAAALKTIDESRSSIEDWRGHAELAQESVAARTRELEQQDALIQSQQDRIALLETQLDQDRVEHEAALAEQVRRVEEQAALGKSLLDQLQQAERQVFSDRERAQQDADRLRLESDNRLAELAAREREIAQLRSDIDSIQQRLRQVEATKQSTAERAERAAQVVSTLRGQVHTLDEAAQRITGLQHRLAEIEAAWVQASEQIDEAEDPDAEEIESVMLERQRMSVELDTLNQQRDAAVAHLRDSALRLRAITELPLPNGAPVPEALPPARPARRWWKRGG